MSDWLLEEQHGGVMQITLNRPDRLNALADAGDGAAFQDLFQRINQDESVRAVILTGAGKAFSAGGNVKDMLARRGLFDGTIDDIAEAYRTNVHEIVRAVWGCQVPIIAAVNGAAVGLGHDVAGYCDIRLASQAAKFGSSFASIGLIPGDGGAWLLPRNIGLSRAATMLYTGALIDADQALSWGLVTEVLSPDDLLSRAHEVAAQIAAKPPLAIRETKRLMRAAMEQDLPAALESAATAQAPLHRTQDHEEALKAFFEKRDGQYQGK